MLVGSFLLFFFDSRHPCYRNATAGSQLAFEFSDVAVRGSGRGLHGGCPCSARLKPLFRRDHGSFEFPDFKRYDFDLSFGFA